MSAQQQLFMLDSGWYIFSSQSLYFSNSLMEVVGSKAAVGDAEDIDVYL